VVFGLGRCMVFLKVCGWESGFPSVQKLLDFLRRRKMGSEQSKATFCSILCRFCRIVDKLPDELVALPREENEGLVQSFCDKLLDGSRLRGASARHPNTALACLKTFFRVNGFNRESGNELRLNKYHQPPRVRNRNEYIPTLEEAYRMAERAGTPRNRAIIRALYGTGLRNSALRALRYGDIQSEIESGNEVILINVCPEMNSRVAGACKGNILYCCFLPKQATLDVRDMLNERMNQMGKIDSAEPLFPNYNRIPRTNRVSKILTSRELALIVKNSARNAGIKEWKLVTPHSLRKVFERVLRSTLSDGSNLDPKDQEYFMGHLLPRSQDTYYDKTKIEEMRAKYAKLVFEPGPSTQELSMRMLEKMAQAYGIDVEKLLLHKKDMLGRPLSLKECEEAILSAMKSLMKSGGSVEQKIVSESELETMLSRGWRMVQALPSGRVVVEKLTTPNQNAEDPHSCGGESMLTENNQESSGQVELEKPGQYSPISYLPCDKTKNKVSRESKHKAQPNNDSLEKSLSIKAPQTAVSPKDSKQGYAVRPVVGQTQLASYPMSQEPQVRKIDVNQEILPKAKSPISDTNRLKLKSKNIDLGLFL